MEARRHLRDVRWLRQGMSTTVAVLFSYPCTGSLQGHLAAAHKIRQRVGFAWGKEVLDDERRRIAALSRAVGPTNTEKHFRHTGHSFLRFAPPSLHR